MNGNCIDIVQWALALASMSSTTIALIGSFAKSAFFSPPHLANLRAASGGVRGLVRGEEALEPPHR